MPFPLCRGVIAIPRCFRHLPGLRKSELRDLPGERLMCDPAGRPKHALYGFAQLHPSCLAPVAVMGLLLQAHGVESSMSAARPPCCRVPDAEKLLAMWAPTPYLGTHMQARGEPSCRTMREAQGLCAPIHLKKRACFLLPSCFAPMRTWGVVFHAVKSAYRGRKRPKLRLFL